MSTRFLLFSETKYSCYLKQEGTQTAGFLNYCVHDGDRSRILPMPQRILLFSDKDSACHLKVEGEDRTLRFGDFLEALHYAHSVVGTGPAEVVVYDSTGKVALRSQLKDNVHLVQKRSSC